MKLFTLIDQVRAAHAVASAFDHRRKPRTKDLRTLGLDETLAHRFKR